MASIANDKDGTRRLLFAGVDGTRKAIRLGKMPKKAADGVRRMVEAIVHSQVTGSTPELEVSRFIANLSPVLRKKLANVGLVEPVLEVAESTLLGPFIRRYVAERGGTRKPGTIMVWNQAVRCLVDYFGENRPLRKITAGDADTWREQLLSSAPMVGGGERLSENTVRRRCGHAKQFFRAAVRKRLITENPFEGLETTIRANRSKDHVITREDASAILDACPNAEWRLIFALSRFGGLRTPSEHLALRWQDIDWGNQRMTVTSPKTEHHEGKDSRLVPIFPELLPLLEAVFDAGEPGGEFVITQYRKTNANLRTQFVRIIKRAGLTPWPDIFRNLRKTRQTELAADFPAHVVCEWMGNSEAVAREHYLRVTADDFRKAAQFVRSNRRQRGVPTRMLRETQQKILRFASLCNPMRGLT